MKGEALCVSSCESGMNINRRADERPEVPKKQGFLLRLHVGLLTHACYRRT
jgi:hypothetical protein